MNATPFRAKRLTEEIRRSAGGDYVRLRAGVTHFRVERPAAGVPIVLLQVADALRAFVLGKPRATA